MRRLLASELDLPAVVSGEKIAWDRFAEKCAGLILSTAKRLLDMKTGQASMDDARDIAQDVFTRLVKNDFKLLKSYDPAKSSLSTWLTVITRSTAIDYLRATAKHRPVQPLEDDYPAEQNESLARVDVPLEMLSERQRQVVQMLYYEDLDVSEVAQRLMIRNQTVRSLKHKALDKLRAHFGYSQALSTS